MRVSRLLLAAGTAASGCVAWGAVQAHRYHLVTHRLAVLPPGMEPLRVLQVSDTHLCLANQRLAAFLSSLAEEPFDLVFVTGDMLGEPEVAERTARLLGGLQGRLGKYYVMGSSDYYAPTPKGYWWYFRRRRKPPRRLNRTAEFERILQEQGFAPLCNATVHLDLLGVPTQITGLDDPFLRRDDRSLLRRSPEARLAICVVHDPAPYLDIADAGYDLAIAGHTHGGQVRMPLVGALVTNSVLPRHMAKGASWVGDTLLYVTQGLGTSKYAPFRFLCPPEAAILELVPRGG